MKKILFASLCTLLMACESKPSYQKMLETIPKENHRGNGINNFGKPYLFFNYVKNNDSIALIFNYKTNLLSSKRVYDRNTNKFKPNEFIHYKD